MKNIFIDCGHGGKDSGAIGIDIKEKDYTLLIGTKVINELKNYNCNVFYSRINDKTVSLEERCKLSNSNNCDIFISIHCNSFGDNSANGFETFSYGGNSSLQNNIHNEIIKAIPIYDRGKKKSNFYVLKHTKAKAVLLELGFITNAKDSILLNNRVDDYVNAIVQGIIKELGLTPQTTTREIYRVCVGSYTIKENADNMMQQLEKDGYKPFITKATI